MLEDEARPTSKAPFSKGIGLFLLVLLLLFFGLGSYGLLEDNEARFFEISWEMERSGDWLTPRMDFISHFHKPPGTFWAVAASLALFGETELAGRLPIVFSALITLALVGLWGRDQDDADYGLRSVLVLVTTIEFWFLSRLVLTDMFLTMTVTSALFFAWRARRSGSTSDALLFWLSLAFSTLFKGPIGLAVVIPVLGLTTLFSPKPRKAWNLRAAWGLPLFLALSLPWYVAVCLRNDGLLEYFLNFQTAQRFMTTVHGRGGAWWFYLPVVVAGFFPWTAALPQSMLTAYRRRDDFSVFLLSWFLYPLVFFSVSGSKLPTYLLPIFPALAMLVARSSPSSPQALRVRGGWVLGGLALFAAALAGFLTWGKSPEMEPARGHLWAFVGLCLVGLGVVTALRRRLDDHRWFCAGGALFSVFLLLIADSLGPCDGAYSARRLAQEIKAHRPEPTVIAELADHLHGLPYYLDRRLVQISYPRETQFDDPSTYRSFLYRDLATFLQERAEDVPSTLIVLRKSDYENHDLSQWSTQPAGAWFLLRPPVGSAPKAQTQSTRSAP